MSAPVWGVVPAAGIGSRMGSEIPKQYLPLAGRNVLACTLQALRQAGVCKHIVVALHPQDDGRYLVDDTNSKHILTVTGGIERSDSVLAALKALTGRAALQDWVLVHDAARPCVRRDAILRLLQQAEKNQMGAILAVPVVDTVKRSTDGVSIEQTVDRKQLWCAQTPQLFRYGLLYEALSQASEQGIAITDEASAMESAGHPVQLVQGSTDNLKITHPNDLALAQWYLDQRRLEQE